jgi:hypothetical protein
MNTRKYWQQQKNMSQIKLKYGDIEEALSAYETLTEYAHRPCWDTIGKYIIKHAMRTNNQRYWPENECLPFSERNFSLFDKFGKIELIKHYEKRLTKRQKQVIIWYGKGQYYWNGNTCQWEFDNHEFEYGLTKYFDETMIF